MALRTMLCLFFAVAVMATGGRAWLGLGFTHHISGEEQWLVVRFTFPNGPGHAAGIREGDIITAIDGKPLRYRDSVAMLEALAAVAPGSRLKFDITRGQEKLTRAIIAGRMTDEQYRRWKEVVELARRKREASKR